MPQICHSAVFCWTALPRTSHTCSIQLRSGDIAGHSKRLTLLACRNPSTILARCGLALSSWKMPFLPIGRRKGTTWGHKISSKWRCPVSIPGTTTRSVRLSAVTPAQTMTLPPLYAWRGCTLTSAWRSPFWRQTRSRPSMCRRQNRLSSENVTVRHCCLFHLMWLRANWRRAALCLWERQDFLAGTRDLSPAAWSRFRMVWTETGMPDSN